MLLAAAASASPSSPAAATPAAAASLLRVLRRRPHHLVHRSQHQDAGSSLSMVPVSGGEGGQEGNKKRKKGVGNPALQRIAWRKWLSHPGVPGGTLFEREQMSAQLRRAETVHKVQKHRLQRFGVRDDEMEETGQEGNKTVRGGNTGIMTLVEDKIQLAMIRGEFDSLNGKGKPLERERTPGVDRTTDLFMDVLKRNGVLPEWIQRQKRVRAMTGLLLRRLQIELMMMMMDMNKDAEKAHAEGKGAQDGALVRRPSREAFAARVAGIQSVGEDLAVINSEIATYNLQVPALHLQRLRLRLDPLIDEAMLSAPSTYREAFQAYRAASREGLMGCTCLMEHRADFFVDGEDGTSYYVAGGGTNLYWSGAGRKHKKADAASAHIAELLMIPIDGLARALSRMFSI